MLISKKMKRKKRRVFGKSNAIIILRRELIDMISRPRSSIVLNVPNVNSKAKYP
jgi:hypothetical protein